MRKSILFLITLSLTFIPSICGAQTFYSPLDTDKKPWTGVPSVKSDDYKFVIIPDKKGGEENGVFDLAIQEINRIAPDFVITVGDLIEGFVSDASYTVPMWEDFMGRLAKLDAPFFFVGGNHDLTNQAQTDDYVKRFGATYYSFSMGPDLFLILDSQEHGGRDISEKQVEYFKNVLDGWDGRHIYLFMHSPLWYPQNHGGYEEIDSMLQGHQYTVFTGHTHTYYMEERGGMEYYVLATAGGESELRGAEVGEVDHYMLVSARDGKPAIANIPVGSMIPNDIVNRKTAGKVGWMLSDRYVKLPYLKLDGPSVDGFSFDMTASNPMDDRMEFSFAFPEESSMSFAPGSGACVLEPGESKTFHVDVDGCGGIEVGRIPFRTTCGYSLNGHMKNVENIVSLYTDYDRVVGDEPLTVLCKDPYKVSESWDWSGVDDGWFEFEVSRDKKNVIIAVTTHDDIRATDKVIVDFESGGKHQNFEMEPEAAVVRVPVKKVQDGEFLLNVRFVDNDDVREADPSVLWWRSPDHMGRFLLDR